MADPRLVDTLERLVVGAVGLTTTALAGAGPAAELTLPQWRVLVVVAQGDGIRVSDIAGRVGVALPSASRLVRRLEHHGLVQTARDETDRRATIVRATGAGLRVWSALTDRRRRLIADMLDVLDPPLEGSLADQLERIESVFARYS